MFLMDDILANEEHQYPDDGSADPILDEVEAAACAVLCKHYGHEVIDDQCGIPAHRYCIYCNKREGDL